jgi:hypothetical protein
MMFKAFLTRTYESATVLNRANLAALLREGRTAERSA